MNIIKKYILLIILLLITTSGCKSNNNIDTAIANPPTKEVFQQIETDTKNYESSEEISTEEISTEEIIETTTKSISLEEKTSEEVDTSSQTTKQATTEPQEIKMEPITEPNDTDITKSTEKQTQLNESENLPNNISSKESNTLVNWSFKRNKDHSKVIGYNQGIDLSKFDAYYIGDTSKKIIYLTFDEGYEYGYTPSILDTLKQNNVKATFFLTKAFIESEPELSKRMADDGHIVGNHSVTHPDMPNKTDEEIIYEIKETERYYKEITGYTMDKFFRPPAGKFSERTLDITKQLDYKTIFWSLAYGDWDVNNQPGKEAAYKHIMDNYHDGGIFLLHAVSKSNTEALDDIIKALKQEGYSFASLYDLP